jgi:membrane associated rhomboid family serine protease
MIGNLDINAAGQHFAFRYGVSNGEYYRLVTSMFVHYGPIHLLANMWALWVIGRVLESALGPLRYTILYFVAGIGGSVAVYLFAPSVQSAGASGAIFGLFAALFIIFKRLRLDTSQLVPVIVINVIISFAPGISFAAHFGGAVTGAIVAWVMAYAPQRRRNLITSGVIAGLLVLFAIAIVAQTASLSSLPPPPS